MWEKISAEDKLKDILLYARSTQTSNNFQQITKTKNKIKQATTFSMKKGEQKYREVDCLREEEESSIRLGLDQTNAGTAEASTPIMVTVPRKAKNAACAKELATSRAYVRMPDRKWARLITSKLIHSQPKQLPQTRRAVRENKMMLNPPKKPREH